MTTVSESGDEAGGEAAAEHKPAGQTKRKAREAPRT